MHRPDAAPYLSSRRQATRCTRRLSRCRPPGRAQASRVSGTAPVSPQRVHEHPCAPPASAAQSTAVFVTGSHCSSKGRLLSGKGHRLDAPAVLQAHAWQERTRDGRDGIWGCTWRLRVALDAASDSTATRLNTQGEHHSQTEYLVSWKRVRCSGPASLRMSGPGTKLLTSGLCRTQNYIRPDLLPSSRRCSTAQKRRTSESLLTARLRRMASGTTHISPLTCRLTNIADCCGTAHSPREEQPSHHHCEGRRAAQA